MRGFEAPEAYDRGRPSMPSAAVADLASKLGLTSASAVLDLGAGTGMFTRELVPLIGQVIAVEPSERMLTALRQRLPSVDAQMGTRRVDPARRCLCGCRVRRRRFS